ncbi:hypothetical protein BBJ28_00014486 [Nothophytophthora sp. Chile5]|nr:hypothetical protein BBJ28_00014486 [Nothophytophthora sp. Chile5]
MSPGRHSQQPQPPTNPNSGTEHDGSSSRSHGVRAGGEEEESSAPSTEWQRDEHARFMQALETYGSLQTGDEWTHITAFVGTRSIEEVRLHGHQYLQRLVQQLPSSSPLSMASRSRYISTTCSQNDPNHQNYQDSAAAMTSQKLRSSRAKKVVEQSTPPVGTSAMSAAAMEAAQALNVHPPIQQQQQQQKAAPAPRRNGRRPKVWTFQEDKTFETALAGWVGAKPYPWTKIASTLPGKTAKDVRNRYEKLVGDISSIETGALVATEASTSTSEASSSVVPRGARARPLAASSTLSRRAIPPPPIEVPPNSLGKDGALLSFPSSGSTRSSSGGSASAGLGFGMLSPTFLDLLANDGDSEEKLPLPSLALPFPGLSNLPQKAETGATRGQPESDDVEMQEVEATARTGATRRNEAPRRSTTPRIWHDFLADDFKFDEPLSATPSRRNSSRKTPRSTRAARLRGGSSAQSGVDASGSNSRQDVEMAGASAN